MVEFYTKRMKWNIWSWGETRSLTVEFTITLITERPYLRRTTVTTFLSAQYNITYVLHVEGTSTHTPHTASTVHGRGRFAGLFVETVLPPRWASVFDMETLTPSLTSQAELGSSGRHTQTFTLVFSSSIHGTGWVNTYTPDQDS